MRCCSRIELTRQQKELPERRSLISQVCVQSKARENARRTQAESLPRKSLPRRNKIAGRLHAWLQHSCPMHGLAHDPCAIRRILRRIGRTVKYRRAGSFEIEWAADTARVEGGRL